MLDEAQARENHRLARLTGGDQPPVGGWRRGVPNNLGEAERFDHACPKAQVTAEGTTVALCQVISSPQAIRRTPTNFFPVIASLRHVGTTAGPQYFEQ